ncbi:hypothetical protein ACFLUX_03040 [Chloroflexota bacterium]
MKKTRLVWILTGLAALVTVVLILFLPNPHDLSVGRAKVEQLPQGQAILGNAWPELQSVQKGDAFLYIIEVLYNTGQVSEIDRDSLDNNVNLEPFEIRNTEETEFNLDTGTRVYQRQYEIQLISGEVEHLYEFPTIALRYKLKYADGFADTAVVPEPVFVAPRFPNDISSIISNLELGYDPLWPLEGETEDAKQNRLPWIFWSLGGLLAVLAVSDLLLRVIPQWKEHDQQEKKGKMVGILGQAYPSLKENIATDVQPGSLLHQMDHILRIILSQKVEISWLEEPNLDLVSDGIKPSVISLFEKCQRAYGAEDIKQEEVEEGLRQIEEILEFYFAEEMGAWKS